MATTGSAFDSVGTPGFVQSRDGYRQSAVGLGSDQEVGNIAISAERADPVASGEDGGWGAPRLGRGPRRCGLPLPDMRMSCSNHRPHLRSQRWVQSFRRVPLANCHTGKHPPTITDPKPRPTTDTAPCFPRSGSASHRGRRILPKFDCSIRTRCRRFPADRLIL